MKAANLLFRLLTFYCLIVCSFKASAQEFTAGINTETPNPHAVLHLVAPNGDQGLLIPTLTRIQRNGMALTTAENGMLVFDTDDGLFYYYFNGWVALTTADTFQNTQASGDISGDFINGFTVNQVGGSISTDISTATTAIIGNPTFDRDSTDDLALTTSPVGGDISGDFATGLIVNQVGGAASADISTATTAIIGNPAFDRDSLDDMTIPIYDPNLIAGNVFDLGLHTTTTVPGSGDVLTFNGTTWDAAPVAGGDLAATLLAGSDAAADSIYNLSRLGIRNAGTLNPLQIGGNIGISPFENATEGLVGDMILKNLYIDDSNPTDNLIKRVRAGLGSFMYMTGGSVFFLRVANGAQDSQVDITTGSTEITPWVEFNQVGNTLFGGGVSLGNPAATTEQEGMLRFDGVNIQGFEGGIWKNLTGGGVSFPFAQTLNTDPVDMFLLEQQGTTSPTAHFINSSATNTANTLSVENNGSAGSRSIQSIHSGSSGDAGEFSITNTINPGGALLANTAGTGVAGSFLISNALNTSSALNVETIGGGAVIRAFQGGISGPGIDLAVSDPTNSSTGMMISHDGLGAGLEMRLGNITSTKPAIAIDNLGSGSGIEISTSAGPNITLNGDTPFFIPTGAILGHVLTSDAVGNAVWAPPLTLPYSNVVANTDTLFSLTNTVGPAAGFTANGIAAYFTSLSNTSAIRVEGDIEFPDGSTRNIGVLPNLSGAGDQLRIISGAAGGTGGNGGDLSLSSGPASGIGNGGNIIIEPGTGAGGGNLGEVFINGNVIFSKNFITPPDPGATVFDVDGGTPVPVDSRVVKISGTTLFTNIATGVDGQEIILVCENGSPQAAAGGNMRLSNTGALSMTLGSTLHLIYIESQTMWLEIGRSE